MKKETKVTSLELSKKIYELTKKKGIELESEYVWAENSYLIEGYKVKGKKIVLMSGKILPLEVYPALDTAELGEIIPGNVDGYIFQMQKGMMGNRYFYLMSKMAGVKIKNEKRHEEMEKTMPEAMGQMYFYLLDNNLICK